MSRLQDSHPVRRQVILLEVVLVAIGGDPAVEVLPSLLKEFYNGYIGGPSVLVRGLPLVEASQVRRC
jgi:hypothetical protein